MGVDTRFNFSFLLAPYFRSTFDSRNRPTFDRIENDSEEGEILLLATFPMLSGI